MDIKQYISKLWVEEAVSKAIKIHTELKGNKNTTCQNIWDAAKVVLKGKIVALNYIRNEERVQKQYSLAQETTRRAK